MALRKALTTEQGYTAEYWKINPVISVDFASTRATTTIILYANATARQDNKRWVEIPHELYREIHDALNLEGEAFTTALATGDLRAAFYTKLKASVSFFSDAEDC